MMKDDKSLQDIRSFLASLQDLLAQHGEGLASMEDLRQKLGLYRKEFAALEAEHQKPGSVDYIKGLLYQHNRNNFCRCTGVFFVEERKARLLLFHGDDILLPHAHELLRISSPFCRIGEIKDFNLTIDDKSYQFHIFMYEAGKRNYYLLAATGSKYYDSGKLALLGHLLENLTRRITEERSEESFSLFNETSDEILDLIRNRRYRFAAAVVLNRVEDIFSHSGIPSLIALAEEVQAKLKELCPPEARIVSLGFSVYFVLYITEDPSLEKQLKKLKFTLGNASIPYQVLHYRIDTPDLMEKFFQRFDVKISRF